MQSANLKRMAPPSSRLWTVTVSPTDTSNKFLLPDVTCRSSKLVATTAPTMPTKTEIANTKPTELRTTRRMQKKGECGWAFRKSFNNSRFFLYSISSTTDSRMSTPGIQSTSNTPPAYFLDRTTSTSTFPDGLNHALSQENIRLQQIVCEHKVGLVCSGSHSINWLALSLSQLKEEALQRELHFMRLALLKNNSCQCNSSKDKQVASNHSDDMVRLVIDIAVTSLVTQPVDFYSTLWSTATRRTRTARGRRSTSGIQSFPFCGCRTTPSLAARAARSSSGWDGGNITAGAAGRSFAAIAANILHPSPKRV